MIYYRFYPGDYARDTGHLSLREHGAYLKLLNYCYSTGKNLPAEDNILWRICSAIDSADQRAVDAVADQFFPLNGTGERHNRRIDRQLPADLALIDLAKRGGEARALLAKRNESGRFMPIHSPAGIQPDIQPDIQPAGQPVTSRASSGVSSREASPPDPDPDPDKDKEKEKDPRDDLDPKKRNKRYRKSSDTDEFMNFKITYPPRCGNQPWPRAKRAINARIKEGHSSAEITAGARRYSAWCKATGKLNTEHVMQAATFCGPDKPFLEPWDLPSKTMGQNTDAERDRCKIDRKTGRRYDTSVPFAEEQHDD